jgi:DNA repair exonuclease SbcCD nuclease subunit
MKIVLVSDIHLGVKGNSETFLNNTKKFFIEQVCDVIAQTDAKMLWVLGDLFDKPDTLNILVKNVALEIFSTILDKFPDLKVKLLLGNHDIYYKTTLEVNSLNMFSRFNDRLEVIKTIKAYDLDGCKTMVVPWLIQDSNNHKNFFKYVDYVNQTGIKKYDLCLGHFAINGFEIVKGTIEERGISQDVFKVFDQVFSGHFHLRRQYNNMQYLGCPYEITWNDYGDPKGITVFDTSTRTIEFFENSVSPKHKIIRLTSILQDKTIVKDAVGNFVKYIVDKVVPQHIKDKVQEKLEELSYRLDILDETELLVEGQDVGVVDDSLLADTKSMLNDYLEKIELPANINKQDFLLYISKIHDSIRDEV